MSGGLDLCGLHLAYGARRVLTGVSLSFRAGEVTAVIGPNGAGKSSLLLCAAGLIRPQDGEARLDGRPILELAPRARAQRIAYLPQTTEIAWPITVRALVGLGRLPHHGVWGETGADRAAILEAITAAGVQDLTDRPVATLSGGERARVLVARGLAGAPRFLLADEPTAGLDPGHALDMADLFRAQARRGVGVVVTLHDLSLAARVADRIVILAGGRVLADGAPQEALSEETIAAAYGVRARVQRRDDALSVEIISRA
jgi:iron complex transport system ATP-binding protein